MRATRHGIALGLALALASAACAEPDASPPDQLWVPIGGETFTLEIAADRAARQRGLSGRGEIPRNGGMLFVLPQPRSMAMVMRDCSAPIDVAFLDARGVVVAIYEMQPEAPRGPRETAEVYERRLPTYPSGVPIHLAIETAGGRLREVGLEVGQRIEIDVDSLSRGAR